VIKAMLEKAWNRGEPQRCRITRMIAYKTEKEAKAAVAHLPVSTTHLWECAHCGGWHRLGYSRGPTSENKRSEDQQARNEQRHRLLLTLETDSEEEWQLKIVERKLLKKSKT
jgi:hypothetical protein